ncbi:MAG: acyl-CoA dehydrogenase [Burkholderiaceae bacterium]|nr:MAG: acyl-CoA dehydrogenase [Burkholderiaceae bacterium]
MNTTDIGVSPHVKAYNEKFQAFLDERVAPIEKDLARQGVGTPWNPKLDEAGRMHPAVWAARREVQRLSGKAGLYAPHIGAAAGGGGFGLIEQNHAVEFVYRHSGLGLGLAAYGWTEGPSPVLEHCSAEARERWLTPLIHGEISAAFANTEESVGSDVLAMGTHAARDGTDWIINGTKAWITNAHFADLIQVVAVTEPGAGTRSLSMFLVDAKAPGFSRGRDIPTMLNDGLTGTLHFDDVRVPAECIVGEIGDGFSLAMAWINWRRLSRGGMCAGWGRWLLHRARTFARERKSGGHPIADLQAVQHLIADMDLNIYQAHAAALVALTELEALGGPYAVPLDHRAPRLVSLVKVINDEAFYRVTDNAVQVRGAVGLLLGSPEEKLFRVARNLRIPAGTSEIQRNAIARGVMKYS